MSSSNLLSEDDTTPELRDIGLGAAGGALLGAALPILFRGVGRKFGAREGAQVGAAVGAMSGAAMDALVAGFHAGAAHWLGRNKKQADETFKGIGTGALSGAGINAGSILPVLFGRLGKRLPTRVLNKMLLGRALSGAAIGAAAGGIAAKSRPKDNVYHYYYHKSLKEKGLGG